MVPERICLLLASVLLLSATGSAQDIHEAKEIALRNITNDVAGVIKLGNETNTLVERLPPRIHEIHTLITRQGARIMDNNLAEIQDETKTAYMRADILKSTNDVYGCIARSGNNGEVSIKNDHKSFLLNANSELKATDALQTTTISKWKQDTDVQVARYRNDYNYSTKAIYEATQIAQINVVMTNFANSTAELRKVIQRIVLDLQKVHHDFHQKIHGQATQLRTKMVATKATVLDTIKKCFPAKLDQ